MLCTGNVVSAADPIHGPTQEVVQEWSRDADLLALSTRLLEGLGSIAFADEPGWPSLNARERIASSQRRLLLSNVAILEGWVHAMHTKAVEDYVKVNETLFVEAWQVQERRKLHSPHELSTFISHREDVDINRTAAAMH